MILEFMILARICSRKIIEYVLSGHQSYGAFVLLFFPFVVGRLKTLHRVL